MFNSLSDKSELEDQGGAKRTALILIIYLLPLGRVPALLFEPPLVISVKI